MTKLPLNDTLLRRFALAAFAGLLLGLAGCNTVSGFGQDMSAAGHSISNAAAK
ncbi:entericidin A/B family lipoprotein [Paraburkholderia rhizosphaerae]|uniref:Entericidin A n=1 Tax=Paraburkholderia rhizosphaerae TaxID=480658 RepID=A0A4R8M014_9BURK|nr:entericidin A/B family lipoprotein [Paraburkholderia rhizosphaerae]TDY53856.1 entericidin A [Paraburkholderia rhizosphaerae]